jgi:hypothetical protein
MNHFMPSEDMLDKKNSHPKDVVDYISNNRVWE